MIAGWKLIDRRDGTVAKSWGGVYGSCPEIPNPMVLPGGDIVCGTQLGNYGHFDLVAWDVGPGAEQVEAETARRIMLRLDTTDFMKCIAKQMNAQARANALNYKLAMRVTLSEDEQDEVAKLQRLHDDINNIRAKGKAIEKMSSIPEDYMADHHWE